MHKKRKEKRNKIVNDKYDLKIEENNPLNNIDTLNNKILLDLSENSEINNNINENMNIIKLKNITFLFSFKSISTMITTEINSISTINDLTNLFLSKPVYKKYKNYKFKFEYEHNKNKKILKNNESINIMKKYYETSSKTNVAIKI